MMPWVPFSVLHRLENRDGGCLTVYWVVISLLVLFLTFERLRSKL